MNKSCAKVFFFLITINLFMLLHAPAFADERMRGENMRGPKSDWVQHTQVTLDRLKVKLTLAPSQVTAWDTWSKGVLTDAHQQMEQGKSVREEKAAAKAPEDDETTPQRMSRGIAHLREQTEWMQKQLARLEAAQVRTATFYNALNANQKTIFDMYWHEMHHQIDGHDGDGSMCEECMHPSLR